MEISSKKSKEELLADFYALRAGLSVVSIYADELRQIEETDKQNMEKKREQEKEVREKRSSLQAKEFKITWVQKQQEAIQKQIAEKQAYLCNKKQVRKDVRKEYKELYPLGALFEEEYIVAMLLFFWAILPFRGLIFAPIAKAAIKHNIIKKEKKKISDLQTENETLKIEQIELSKTADLLRKEAEDTEKCCEEAKQRYDLQKVDLTKQNGLWVEKIKGVKDSLNRTYDNQLSESDWKNLDLVIYYLETGRADNLKEALQLLDKQLQTNQITNEIRRASETISANIYMAAQKMGEALARSFSVISNQLAQVNSNLKTIGGSIEQSNEKVKGLSERMELIRTNMGQQLSAIDLNNALLEKSNMSSTALLEDLRYGQRYWVK